MKTTRKATKMNYRESSKLGAILRLVTESPVSAIPAVGTQIRFASGTQNNWTMRTEAVTEAEYSKMAAMLRNEIHPKFSNYPTHISVAVVA
jgi:hypothetical protein